jgi:hypothetical protein
LSDLLEHVGIAESVDVQPDVFGPRSKGIQLLNRVDGFFDQRLFVVRDDGEAGVGRRRVFLDDAGRRPRRAVIRDVSSHGGRVVGWRELVTNRMMWF